MSGVQSFSLGAALEITQPQGGWFIVESPSGPQGTAVLRKSRVSNVRTERRHVANQMLAPRARLRSIVLTDQFTGCWKS